MPNILKKLNSFTAMRVKYGSYAVIASGSSAAAGAGYIGGGYDGNFVAAIQKLLFGTDTMSTLTPFATGRTAGSAMANSGVAGYFAGGNASAGFVGSIDKVDFAADVQSVSGSTLTTPRFAMCGYADSGTAGYYTGGYSGSSPIDVTDRIIFPAETRSQISAVLNQIKNGYQMGMGNKGVAGYSPGGHYGVYQPVINKLAFPGETMSLIANFATGRTTAGLVNNAVAGYCMGGYGTTGFLREGIKFAFPSDTRTTLTNLLTTARESVGSCAHSGTAGYAAGGDDATGYLKKIEKMLFATETCIEMGIFLSSLRYSPASMANSGVL